MKKSLLVLALSVVVGSMSANGVEIKNMSKYKLEGTVSITGIECAGNSKKNKLSFKIAPDQVKKIVIPRCCVWSIEVTALPYGLKGTWGGDDFFAALVTAGISRVRICEPIERFEVLVEMNNSVTIRKLVY